jgi:hypothetical protein
VYSSCLTSIDPTILGTAISRLKSAHIYQVSDPLRKGQIAAILREIMGMGRGQKEELDVVAMLRQAGQKIGAFPWKAEQVNLVKYSLTICARA